MTLTAEFRLEKPVQEAVDDMRSAVSRVRADLPSDLRDPVINKLELAGQPVLAFTIASSRMDEEALSWFVDNEVSRKLLAVRDKLRDLMSKVDRSEELEGILEEVLQNTEKLDELSKQLGVESGKSET